MKSRSGRLLNSIGARLTLWGTVITLIVCATVCVLLYVGLNFSLHHEVDGFLEGEVQEFTSVLLGEGEDQEEEESDSVDEIIQEIRHELGSRIRGDLAVRLLDANGDLIAGSNAKDRLPKHWYIPADAPQKTNVPWLQTIQVSGLASPIRVCSQWIRLPDNTLHLAQATYVLNRVAASLHTFRNICIGAMLVAAVLSLIGGNLLARRSLRPVQRMAQTAQHISATHLSQRLERSGNADEFDRLAETLNAMLSRIERHVRQIQQFTADASHELKTPLAALRGNAEVTLTRARSADELREVIENSIEHYDRLGRLTEDLLLLARGDTGGDILHCERTDLCAAIEDVVDLYAPIAQERGIDLSFAARHKDKCNVHADGARLRQLIGNLIDNAIKFTRRGGHVTVSTCLCDGMAKLSIQDTGRGIPQEHLPHVFDRFYRVDQARSRNDGGVGLGLAICRMIAESHGGTIQLLSTEGEGTTVIVHLPTTNQATHKA